MGALLGEGLQMWVLGCVLFLIPDWLSVDCDVNSSTATN